MRRFHRSQIIKEAGKRLRSLAAMRNDHLHFSNLCQRHGAL